MFKSRVPLSRWRWLLPVLITVTVAALGGCGPPTELEEQSLLPDGVKDGADIITAATERYRIRRQAIISRCLKGKSHRTILAETGYKVENVEKVLQKNLGSAACPPPE